MPTNRKPREPKPVKAWAALTKRGNIACYDDGWQPPVYCVTHTRKKAMEMCDPGCDPIRVLIVPEPRDE